MPLVWQRQAYCFDFNYCTQMDTDVSPDHQGPDHSTTDVHSRSGDAVAVLVLNPQPDVPAASTPNLIPTSDLTARTTAVDMSSASIPPPISLGPTLTMSTVLYVWDMTPLRD